MPLDRRSFLTRGALGATGVALLGGGAGTLLGACGSDADSSSGSGDSNGGDGGLGTLSYQLMWIKNTEFAGQYVADTNGYYEGFDKVELLAGGPDSRPGRRRGGRQGDHRCLRPQRHGGGRPQGRRPGDRRRGLPEEPLRHLQHQGRPDPEPAGDDRQEDRGAGHQRGHLERLPEGQRPRGADITKVPVQFDPQPLINGEVDGWFSYFTNEPNTLRIQGVEPEVFLLADYGFPITGQNQIVKRSFLEKNRAAVKAALLGDIKGWRGAVADPQLPVDLVISNYGKDEGLDPAKELMQSKDQNTLVLTPETATNGICTISPALQKQVIDALALVDLKIDADTLFDTSVVEEIYAENPDLKKAPA